MDWLEQLGALTQSVRDPERWSPESPFFSVNPGEGGFTRYVEAAGGRAVLFREVERVTGGKTVFAASGIPGTVGSGSATLWREILAARRSGTKCFRIWPYEVELEEISSSGSPVVAESYPRACYAVALAPVLPTRRRHLAKTKRDERVARLEELSGANWLREQGVNIEGIEWAVETEDDFDALMQAAALVRMMDSEIPLSTHLIDPTWEGGILGTGGLVLREPNRTRSRSTGKRKPPPKNTAQAPSPKTCPIDGCRMIFKSGRLGWDAHVGSMRTHPNWESSLESPEERKTAFRVQFPSWFKG